MANSGRSGLARQDPIAVGNPGEVRGPVRPRPSSTRRLLAVSLLAAAFGVSPNAQTVADEYRLKAAYIYRFPQFVEWPAPATEGRESLDLCVFPPNPFGRVLTELAQGEQLAGRPLRVRLLNPDSPIETCHVLFLPDATENRRAVIRRAANLPILTVGDSSRFLDEGGIVHLRVIDRRVRFDIDAAAAARAKLGLSSQLLRLAVNVRGGPP